MAFRQLQSLVKGLRKDRLKNQLKARRSQARRALAERLEDRRMFAGPELIAIRPDAGALLRDGDTLNSPPRAFNLLFEGGANLSEASISASSIRLFRSGGDGDFTNGNEVEVALGYVGLVNPGDSDPSNLQQIVMRPASLAAFNATSVANQFPDDTYQIQILGSGPNFLSNTSGEAFNDGVSQSLTFRLDRGAQVVAVVPQPVSRNTQQLNIGATGGNYRLTFNGRTTAPIAHNASAATIQAALLALRNVQPGDVTVSPSRAITFQGQYAGEQIPLMTVDNSGLTGGIGTITRSNALSQASNQIVIYFDNQRLNAAEVTDPKFYRLTDTAGTSTINDDRLLLPESVTYDHINNSAVLFFANDIPEGNYRLDVGVSGGGNDIIVGVTGTLPEALASALVVGSLYDGRPFVSNQFLGDNNGLSNDNTDVDLFRVDLQFGATLSVVLTPATPTLSLRARLLDRDGTAVPMASIVTPPGGEVTWTVPITATQPYYIEIVGANGETGAYRINASVTGTPLNINDNNSWVGNATPVGVVGATTIAVASQIEPQAIPLPPLPGGEDEPGHRRIQRETHINSIGTTPTVPMPTKVIEYHFPDSLGTDPSGGNYTNFLTATERQIVRDIFEIYARKSGFEFIEAQGVGSLAIGKGNLQAINPNISNTPGPSNSGITGLQSPTAIVLNNTIFNEANRFYGDSFTLAMYHQIGHALGLGHSFDQPSIMGSYDEFPAQGNPLQNNVLPGDVDIMHLQRIAPPNSTDIDVFSFSLVQSGRFTAETVAERLPTPSMLNSVLTLYRRLDSGEVELVARNDQYYGADAFLDLTLTQGNYFIAVSSVGNTQFDPRVPDSGFGGSTNGAYELKMNFIADRDDSMRDTDGTAFDGDADGTPGGAYSFWFQASDPAQTIYVDKTDTNGVGTIASPFNTISSALAAAGSRIVVPTTATAAGLIGQRFVVDDGVNAPVTFTYSATAGVQLIHLVAGDTPAQIATKTHAAILAARTAGSLAPTVTPTVSGRIIRIGGIDNLDLGLAPTLLSAPNLVRIVGNGGADQNVDTITDNRPYLIGLSVAETPLADGAEFLVPQGVTVMVHAGALFKMRKANLDVGTSAPDVNRAQGALQLLGTPEHSVFLRSYHDDTVGGNSDGVGPLPASGDFGGVVFRGDSDLEAAGIFLNYVNHTDIHQGGGKVFVGAEELSFSSIHLDDARPTISFNRISSSVTSAISASPNSFEDTIDRLGPDVDGNFLVNNSIDGLFIRVDTPLGSNIDKLTVSGRFDDTDIAHILSENLIIAGAGGGLVRLADGTLQARPAGRLVIDAGVVLKLNRARIEVERGAGTLIAEGTIDAPVIFTSLADDRFGGSGSFNSDRTVASTPARGNWGGLFFGEATSGSIAHSIISFGGGIAPIEGGAAAFNAVEIHQADVRISNTELRDNASGVAAGVATTPRNGRGVNGAAVIYVRGAQPIIVDNIIEDNSGAAISINANALNFPGQRDYGQARGPVNDYEQFADNHGPLVRLNRLENNDINGMFVRGELLTTESIWDDTDIVHVLQSLITVDNLHTYGGLTLQSSNSESLVVKLQGAGAGFTATGSPTDIIDRIGGTIHVLGTAGHPVIFTSLTDDSIGAGFTPSGEVNRNTNNSPTPTIGSPGAWRGFLFDEFSNDRNVAVVRELENPLTNRRDINSTPATAQLLGTLAPNQKSGDENRRLGFEINGFISPNDPNDVDVYSFTGDAGTRVWIDIDRTDTALDAIIEVISPIGTVLARSIRSSNPALPGSLNALPLTQNEHLGGDHYTTNFRDPGFFYVLPTSGLHYVRVRSNPVSAASVASIAGESRGAYQLQIRLQQVNEFPGSTVQFADIRFAQTGIDVRGLPKHSPLVAEAGEVEGNDTFATAQTLVNLLQTDIAALGLSGSLSTSTDVDWYRFDLLQTEVQTIGGVNTNPGTIAVVLDMDFADQLSADTTIAIYDQFQRLIYVSRESNVRDDQPIDASGNINDLSRGSLGNKDPYIGPIHLIPGQSYFVAVMSDRMLPSALTGAFFAAPANAATGLVRLEPVTTLYRVVEDHIGPQGFTTQGNPIVPLTPGGLFDISSPAALNNHVRPFTFGDVQLYVATDAAGGPTGDSLYTVNPFTGRIVTQVTSGNNFVSGENDIQDIVIRSDGRMFGYQRISAGTSTGRVGALVELDPSTGAIIDTQPDNIRDQGPTPNTADLAINLGGHLSRAEQFTTSNEVDALTFRRRTTTGPSSAPVPVYETYYAVREADNSSKLYRGRQNGDASPAIATGTDPRYGVIGQIQPAGVTFASRTFTVSDNATSPSVTSIRVESKLPGSAGNSILLNFGPRPNNTAATVDVSGTTITLNIGATGGPPPTGAPTAAAIVDAINNDPEASQLVTAVIVGGNGANGNGSNGTVALNLFGGFFGGLNGPLTGGSIDSVVAPLRGRVTGLSFARLDGTGSVTGDGALFGVTTAGEFLRINRDTGVVIDRIDMANSLGIPNLNFQGLALGPQNVENGRFANTLFAVTNEGRLVAFDTNGAGVLAFNSAASTSSQRILVDSGTPNAGFFTLTFDTGASRQTTVPISVNAPSTVSVNETQSLDTNAHGGTFTLSFVDDVRAVTSPVASIPASFSGNSESIVVENGSVFPTTPFVIRVQNEQMLVTARSGNTLTVTRGVNGTTADAHPDTASVVEVVSSPLAAPLAAPVSSTLAAGVDLTSPTTTITVASAAAFPSPVPLPYTIRINNEEMVVTAVTGNQLTVQRGQNGTAIAQHLASAQVRVVSGTLTVADGTPFPATGSNIRINNEDIRVVSRSGNVLDVIRGINATAPVAHASGSEVFRLNTTTALPFNATAGQIRTALGALPGIGGIANVQVTFGPLSGSNTSPVTIEFTGALAARNLRPLTADTSRLIGNEIQQLSLNSAVTAGTFQLRFGTQLTAPIPFNANAATVEAALQALPNIGAGNVLVTGAALPAGTLNIEFVGALRNSNVADIVVVDTLLRFNERQQLEMVGGPTGGTFTLTIDDPVNGLVGTTAPLPFNATADLIRTALQNAIPALVGNLSASGGPFAGTPVVIEFTNAFAGVNVAQIFATGSLTGGTAPAVNGTTLPNPTSSSTLTIQRQGLPVSAPIVQGTDGVLSVRDALVALPSIGPGDVQVAGNLQGTGVLVNFIGAFANVVPNAFIVDEFLLENTTDVQITVNLPDPSLPDSFISAPIPSLVANPIGLAFSPLDFNLWHTTNRRNTDPGHGINATPDGTRGASIGGTSMHFGFEQWNIDRTTYIAPGGTPNAQFGIRTTLQHQDLSSNPQLVNSYNFPGGAHGTLTTNSFSLANAVPADRPTLYFNYFLDTENHPGSNLDSDGNDPFRDSARVFASTDGGLTWNLLATNNSRLSGSNILDTPLRAELPGFLSHLSDAALNSALPRSQPQQIVQELMDSTGQWRQARVDLSTYAGQNVMLRFDFATAGAVNDPSLGFVNGAFGEFSSLDRSIRSLNNRFEGFYIDDIIVGFAERGELVTGAVADPGITNLFAAGSRTQDNDPGQFPDPLTGPYQLELRRAGEFQQLGVGGNLLAARFHTNDRHILEGSLTANVTFEPGTPIPSLVPVATVLGGIPFADFQIAPWQVSTAGPFTGTRSLRSGTFSPGQTGSIFQASAADLAIPGAATHQAGVIRFAYRVDSVGNNDGLRFFINGIPQRFPQGSTENIPGAFQLASGRTDYRIVEFPFGSGDPTLGGTDVVFSWLYSRGGLTVPGTAFIDQIQLVQGGTGLLADRNRERAQGVFNITSNFITDSSVRAINVQPAASQPGSIINFPQQNADRLVPGVVIQNNVLAGGSGIRFAGETTIGAQSPVPFGRIINNTIVGNARSGVGIEVVGLASPTILNNILTDLGTGIVDGGVGTVIRTNFFQNNVANGQAGTASLSGGATGSPFVNAAQRNFYLLPGSLAVDSSQETEQDRFNHVTFKNELGIPESPIKAPERDVFGQLRIDSTGSPVGGGAAVFIDRGAVDRSDVDRPYAQLLNPIDNDSAGQDRDPNSSVVYLTNPLLENFQILLGDGRGPNSPFEGTGVNGLTVFDPSNAAVSTNAVRVFHDGELLVQGVDYTLGYNSLTGVLLLTPLSTLWKQTGVYTIALDNTQITDLAGNRLRSNQADGSTQFFILMPDVRLDFGDAPSSYGTFLANNPARHSIQPGATPRLGVRIDSEANAPGTVDGDDIVQFVNVTAASALFAFSRPQVSIVQGPINRGDQLTVQLGDKTETFELVLPGFAPQRGNIAIELSTESIALKLVAAINAALVEANDRTTVSIDPIDGTTLRIQTFGSPEAGIPAEPVTITPLSGLFVTSAGGQLTVNPAFTVMGGEQFTVQIGPDSATFELVLPGTMASGTNVAIALSTDETIVGKLVAAISRELVQEGNAAIVSADATNTAAFNIETFDDEDGAAIGTFTKDGIVYRVFLQPGVPAATTDPREVLGFLNPLDPLGANISITVTSGGLLDAWIDFNGNGSFDFDEQIFASTPVVEGVNTLRIFTPTNVTDKLTWARFRITEQGGVGPTGLAIGGEVEDYQVQIINIPLPTPVDDNFTINEDTVLNTLIDLAQPSLIANDDVPPSTFLPVQFFIGREPQHGTLEIDENDRTTGRFRYTPRADFYGTDTFTYRLANQSNDLTRGIVAGVTYATVTITVRPVNDAPSAQEQTFAGLEDAPFTITAAQLLQGALADANAEFPVGAPAPPFNEINQVLNVVSLQAGTTTITVANANLGPFATPRGRITPTFDPVSGYLISLLYTPNQDVNADHGRVNGDPRLRDSFIFTIEDDGILQTVDGVNIPGPVTRLRATNTAFIDIAPQNDAPVLAGDAVSVGIVGTTTTSTPWRDYFVGLNLPVPVPTEDTPLTIPSGYLLLNDIAGNLTSVDENTFINGNDGPLRIVSVSTLTPGMTVSLNSAGNVVLTPPANVYGDVVFTYTVEDRGINETTMGVRTPTPLQSTATVIVTLQPINDPPVAFDRNLSFVESLSPGTGPAFTFNAARLITGIAGETPSVPGDFAPGLVPPFNEVEQTLRIVAFRTSAGTVDVDSLPGGNGTLTLASDAGGTFTFTFVNGAFTTGSFVSAPDYNQRAPFASNEPLEFLIADNGRTTRPQGSGFVFLDGERALTMATATITITQSNDAPIFVSPGRVDVLERDDSEATTVPFASSIQPGPTTALDELDLQTVSFEVIASLSTIPANLFLQNPVIAADGSLSVFPAPDAVGSAIIVFDAVDAEPGNASFVERRTRGTVTINVRPVNDAPRLNPAVVGTTVTRGPDDGWAVDELTGTIRFTLKEDNTGAGGVTSAYIIDARRTGSAADRLGMLDPFVVGPANEANATLGGSQTLRISAFAATTALGGTVTVLATDPVSGAPIRFAYTPPTDYNRLQGDVDSFVYTITDNAPLGETWDLGVAGLIEDNRSVQGRIEFLLNPVNDRPIFTIPSTTLSVLEDAGAVVIADFATNIAVATRPTTAVDEVADQTLTFTLTPVTAVGDLFAVPPSISPDGTLTFTPATDAVGSVTYDVLATDTGLGDLARGDIRQSLLTRITLHIRPVNDEPRLNPAVLDTNQTQGPDEAWEVDSAGTITFTLKEDNTGAGGVLTPFILDARRTSSAANRIGLLDPFVVGPANEANSTLGGSQSLRISAFATRTALGGTISVLETDSVSGAPVRFAYTPPTDYNRLQGDVDSFVYTVTDNAPLGETWNLGQAGLIEDNRSVQGRIEFVLNPVNDRPIFTVSSPTLSVLEDAGPVLIVNFATNISVASPTTALDELPAQTLTFSLTPVTSVGNLFAVPPSISPNGTLTFTPAVDAVGSVTYDVFATDTGVNNPTRGDLNRSLPTRITLHIRPVNDAPRLDATVLGTSQTQNNDEAWEVDSSGVITYTLKEDNTGALGVTSPYIINVRRNPAIVGYQRVGLIDIFTVGPTNEADSTLGGSQVLRLFSFGNQGRTALGGTIRAIGFDANNDVTQLEYIPPVDFNETIGGLDSFTFTVQDNNPGGGETFNLGTGQLTENRLTASSTVQFRLRTVNDPPQFNVAEPVVSVLEDTGAVSFEDFVTDIFAGPPNTAFDEIDQTTGQNVTFSVTEVTTVAGLFATPPTISPNGTLSFVTAPDAFGQAVYEVRATDDGMDNATRGDIVSSGFRLITINVRPVNDRPVLNTTTPIVVTLNEDATILNTDGTITNRGTLIPLRGTTASPGLLDIFAPGPANEASALTPGGNQSIRISTPIPTGTVNGGTLSRELDSLGNLIGLRYTPRPNFNGIDSFVYGVIDNGVSADIDGVVTNDPREGFTTVTLQVRALNDAPVFGGAPSVTVQEDATTTTVVGQTIIPNWATNIQAGPAGALDELNPVTGQIVTFTVNPVTGNPAGLFTVAPTVSSDGTLRFTTARDANGVAVFTVVASDNGTSNPPLEFNTSSPPRTFTITVGGVNDPPTFTAGGNVVVNEDSGQFSSPTPFATNISPGPADEVAAGQTVRFEVVTPASGRSLFAEGGLPQITDAGFLRFTPADNANGAVVVSVTAIDSEGGRSATVSLTITIEEVNDTPVANNDSFTTNEDSVLTITREQLLANDVDPDLVTNPNEVLSIFGVPAVSLSGAVLRLGTNGTLEYDPRGATALQALAPGQTRSDTFIYRLRDAAGAVSNTATVTVNVTGINDAPTLLPDTPTLAPSGDTIIRPLLNDFDIDGTINPASLRIDLQPAFGSVRVEPDGTLIYTPFAGFRGQDVIRYSVADNLGLRSEQQTITIDINQAPLAVNDSSGTFRDESIDINVAANDSDSDGTLNLNSIQIVTQPLRGSVIVVGGGIVRYLPEPGFTGLESFQYTIRDNGGRASNVATVTVQTVGSRLQNPRLFTDVNASGETSPIDALLIINLLSRASRQGQTGGIPVRPTDRGPNFFDVDGNSLITAADALRVINQISRDNRAKLSGGEGEAPLQRVLAAPTANVQAATPLSSTVSREALADSAVTLFASQEQIADFGVMDDTLVTSIVLPQEEDKDKQDGDRLAAIDAAWADAAPL